ncbi:hypothetical protein [Winogradskya consettensis]|uniref:hypothetical protein n=1 Tax=Winogradskya consettensis TaxID=113560 RepID=UPI0031D49805
MLSWSGSHHVTPRTRYLRSLADQQFDAEFHKVAALREGGALRTDAVRRRLGALQEDVSDRRQQLEALVSTGPDTARRLGEEAVDEAVVRRRRAREHERLIDAMRFELAAMHKAIADAEAAEAEAAERQRLAVRAAGVRAMATGHAVGRLESLYWQAFLRARRRLKAAGTLRPAPPPRPGWVTEELA